MRTLRRLSLVLPLAVWPAAAHAGVVMEMETHDVASKEVTTSQIFVEGKFVKTTVANDRSAGSRRSAMLYHPAGSADGPAMIMVDDADKTYRVMNEETVNRMANMMRGMGGGQGGQSGAMAAAMAHMTPEQRQAAIQAMQQHGMGGMPQPAAPPKREIHATGASDTVNGISCKIWEETEDGVKTGEICAASASAFSYGADVMPAFMDMAQFMKKLLEAMPVAHRAADNSMALMNEVKGFPVRTRSYDDGKLTTETTFKSGKTQSLPPSFFQPPADYKQQDMMPH